MSVQNRLREYLQVGPVIWAIFAICMLIEAALIAADQGLWSTTRLRSLAYENGGFWIGLLDNWRPNYTYQPWAMFVSYAFLHSGFWHLIVNMITLFSLGSIIVHRIGQTRFLALYVIAMIGGAAGFALLSDTHVPMVGASGALFGLAGAIAAWEYVDRFTAKAGLWPVFRLVLWLVALNVILWWAMNKQLAWETHFGGFAAGWIFAFLIDPRSRPME